MFCELDFDNQLQDLIANISKRLPPDFYNVINDIKNANRKDKCPNYERKFFATDVKNDDGPLLVVMYRTYKTFPFRPALHICYDTRYSIDERTFLEAYDVIIESLPKLFESHGVLICSYGDAAASFQVWFKKHHPEKNLELNPCYFYYMTDEQREILKNECKAGISLPEEYCFDTADPKKDLETIVKTWKHARSCDLPVVKDQLIYEPSSLIRWKVTQEPVAFELADPRGALNHQFVLPEHRRKGLGKAVEKDICFKIVRNEACPFKFVEDFNTQVIEASQRSKYWTRWEKDCKPVMTYHLYYSKERSEALVNAKSGIHGFN